MLDFSASSTLFSLSIRLLRNAPTVARNAVSVVEPRPAFTSAYYLPPARINVIFSERAQFLALCTRYVPLEVGFYHLGYEAVR